MRKQKLLFKEEQEKLGEWIRGKDYIAYFLSELRIGKNADDTIFSPQEELLEAQEDMGVEFIDVDIQAFKDQVAGVQEDMLEDNENIRDIYDHIQEVNAKYIDGEAE